MNNFFNSTFYRYLMVTIGCVIMGIAFNTFYLPNNLLSGGISGIALISYYLFGLPVGIVSIILNIPLFILAYKFMDKDYIVGALYGMLTFSFCLDAFRFMSETVLVSDKMLSCIAGGAMYGIGAALMYRVGGSGGGMDIVGAIIQKYYSISINNCNFIFNIFLLFIGSFLFGIEPVLYTLLTMFVMNKTCNAFVIGFDFKKNIIIISDNPEPIAEAIIKVVGRGVTYLHGEGAYTHRQREILFVVAKLTQTAKIRSIVREIDPNAFMIIHDVNDVFGRGFTLQASSPYHPRPLPPTEQQANQNNEN